MRYIAYFLSVIIWFVFVSLLPASSNETEEVDHNCTLSDVGGIDSATKNDRCLNAKISKLQSYIQNNLLRVETGEIQPTQYEAQKFENTADSIDDGTCVSGDTAHRGIRSRAIKFETPFNSKPKVVLSITSLSVVGTFRITAYPFDETKDGFFARITTFCNTQVHGIKVNWTAYGN